MNEISYNYFALVLMYFFARLTYHPRQLQLDPLCSLMDQARMLIQQHNFTPFFSLICIMNLWLLCLTLCNTPRKHSLVFPTFSVVMMMEFHSFATAFLSIKNWFCSVDGTPQRTTMSLARTFSFIFSHLLSGVAVQICGQLGKRPKEST